jgi:hypothetical protein
MQRESVVSSHKKPSDAVFKMEEVATIPPSGEFTSGVVSSVAAPSGESTEAGSSEAASEISKCFLQLGHMLDTSEMTYLCVICSELGLTPASFATEWDSITLNRLNARPSLTALNSLRLRILQRESVVSSQKKPSDAVFKMAEVATIPPSGEFTPGVVSSVAAPYI